MEKWKPITETNGKYLISNLGSHNKKTTNLGTFKTFEEAVNARKEFIKEVSA